MIKTDGYKVILHKSSWSISEIETAACLGFKVKAQTVEADVRLTRKEPLWGFMKSCYSSFEKETLTSIGQLYDKVDDNFQRDFYRHIHYPDGRALFDHQMEALRDSYHRQYTFLAFTMGLGKTITAASLSKLLNLDRTVIICPSIVKWNWYRELTEDWGYNALEFSMLDRDVNQRFQAIREKFVIVNYEMLDKFDSHLMSTPIDHFIVDECHGIKNHHTRKWKSVNRLFQANPDARVTLMTGTPVTNRIDDLFAYLKITNHRLGVSKTSFNSRYIKKVDGKKQAQNIPELRKKIANFMIRKKTEECIDLPKLNINKYYFNVTDFGANYVSAMSTIADKGNKLEGVEQELKTATGDRKKELTRDKFKLKAAVRMNIHSINRLTAESKVPGTIELINGILREGRKVIVFSPYKAPLEMLKEKFGHNAVLINGSVNPKERQSRIRDFTTKKHCKVFLGQNRAAGVGINLVNARDTIMLGFPFTPDDIEQPIKRCHRMGQKHDVNVYFTIANGSCDEHIYNIVADKLNEINETIDHDKTDNLELLRIEDRLLKLLLDDIRKGNKR